MIFKELSLTFLFILTLSWFKLGLSYYCSEYFKQPLLGSSTYFPRHQQHQFYFTRMSIYFLMLNFIWAWFPNQMIQFSQYDLQTKHYLVLFNHKWNFLMAFSWPLQDSDYMEAAVMNGTPGYSLRYLWFIAFVFEFYFLFFMQK